MRLTIVVKPEDDREKKKRVSKGEAELWHQWEEGQPVAHLQQNVVKANGGGSESKLETR